MAMTVEVSSGEGPTAAYVFMRASGGYAPDVMHDLQNRAAAMLNHAASVAVQVIKALEHEFDEAPEVNDEPVYEESGDE